jgi:hypothetical protein
VGGQVHRPQLAKYLALVVLVILVYDRLEVRQGIGEPALFARYAAQLEMRVSLLRVDTHGILEPL